MPDKPLSIFEELGGAEAAVTETVSGSPHPLRSLVGPSPREEFLTGLLAQWAASDRLHSAARPSKDERKRAATAARAALEALQG